MSERDPVDNSELSDRRSERHVTLGEQPRSAPLIAKGEPDFILRTLVGIVVTLLTFMCYATWNSNRELGEISSRFEESTKATDRRITALEMATDRRLTVLEQRGRNNER